MDFLLSTDSIKLKEWKTIQIDAYYLNYKFNHKIKDRELFWEDQNKILIGDTNIQFANSIKKNNDETEIVQNIKKLTNGFVFYIDKRTQTINLFNDIFGCYHLYYLESDQNTVISNNYGDLTSYSTLTPNSFAFLDMFLFNYT